MFSSNGQNDFTARRCNGVAGFDLRLCHTFIDHFGRAGCNKYHGNCKKHVKVNFFIIFSLVLFYLFIKGKRTLNKSLFLARFPHLGVRYVVPQLD